MKYEVNIGMWSVCLLEYKTSLGWRWWWEGGGGGGLHYEPMISVDVVKGGRVT